MPHEFKHLSFETFYLISLFPHIGFQTQSIMTMKKENFVFPKNAFEFKANNFRHIRVVGIVLICFFCLSVSKVVSAKEIVLWERFKIEPEIAARYTYDDNIYLSDTDTETDYFTTIMPGIDMQLALSSFARIEVLYWGVFDYYREAENFKTDRHYGNTNLTFETAKGSFLKIGAWGEDGANQPYTIEDRYKDFTMGALFADMNMNLFMATALYGTYQYDQRRYDMDLYEQDNYDRHLFSVGVVNSMSSLFPILLEYRYENQQNDDATPAPTELLSQAAFTGFRWGTDQRLSGSLRVGYLWSEYNDSKSYDGWATDTELTYRLGSSTTLAAVAERGVRESTRTERDTQDYYVYAGAGLALTYSRFDRLRLRIGGDFENRDYRSAIIGRDDREDDVYAAGATLGYRFRDWLAFSIGYRYRVNDSTIDTLDYRENRVWAEIILFSVGDVRQKRSQYRLDRIDYF